MSPQFGGYQLSKLPSYGAPVTNWYRYFSVIFMLLSHWVCMFNFECPSIVLCFYIRVFTCLSVALQMGRRMYLLEVTYFFLVSFFSFFVRCFKLVFAMESCRGLMYVCLSVCLHLFSDLFSYINCDYLDWNFMGFLSIKMQFVSSLGDVYPLINVRTYKRVTLLYPILIWTHTVSAVMFKAAAVEIQRKLLSAQTFTVQTWNKLKKTNQTNPTTTIFSKVFVTDLDIWMGFDSCVSLLVLQWPL